jgi:TrmH family RNA methyltransferase
MLSKSQVSLIKSLHQKKFRKENQLFLVEGLKALSEFFDSAFTIHSIYAVKEIFPKLPNLSHKQKVFEISISELEKISALQAPQGVLALIEMPQNTILTSKDITKMVIVLDGVQDPGNLGTIIRTADWFGITNIVCSEDCVEVYNPKVVQATMGSLTRVKISYQDLNNLLSDAVLPKFGTLLTGNNIFNTIWPEKGFLIFGSEGKGISPEISALISHPITIPGAGNTESLNVAVAAAICCGELYRNILK